MTIPEVAWLMIITFYITSVLYFARWDIYTLLAKDFARRYTYTVELRSGDFVRYNVAPRYSPFGL